MGKAGRHQDLGRRRDLAAHGPLGEPAARRPVSTSRSRRGSRRATSRSSAATACWMRDRFAGTTLPLHKYILVALGMNIIDNAELTALGRNRRAAQALGIHVRGGSHRHARRNRFASIRSDLRLGDRAGRYALRNCLRARFRRLPRAPARSTPDLPNQFRFFKVQRRLDEAAAQVASWYRAIAHSACAAVRQSRSGRRWLRRRRPAAPRRSGARPALFLMVTLAPWSARN